MSGESDLERDRAEERHLEQAGPEHDLIRDLAEVLAGLQVQRSIDGGLILGAALAPWDRITQQLDLFGWQVPAGYEEALRRRLTVLSAGARP